MKAINKTDLLREISNVNHNGHELISSEINDAETIQDLKLRLSHVIDTIVKSISRLRKYPDNTDLNS